MKRRFIVTADDYGVSPIIDKAVEEAVRLGIVTSVALRKNGGVAIPYLKNGRKKEFKVLKKEFKRIFKQKELGKFSH